MLEAKYLFDFGEKNPFRLEFEFVGDFVGYDKYQPVLIYHPKNQDQADVKIPWTSENKEYLAMLLALDKDIQKTAIIQYSSKSDADDDDADADADADDVKN